MIALFRPIMLRLFILLAGLVLLLAWPSISAPPTAAAVLAAPSNLKPQTSNLRLHPAPSVIHDFQVTINKDEAEVRARFMVSPPLVPQVYGTIDTDGDGAVSAAEQQAWITKYLSTLQVSVDGVSRPVVLERATPFSREQFL